MADSAKVVIVGGGFGGINAARALKRANVELTVVDQSNHHLFQPLLYQVATATLSPADIAMPIRHILRRQRNAKVMLGEVTGVDTKSKHVILADGIRLPYDYLILATGATHSYFGHPEWALAARGLKSIEDATFLRGEILAAFEYAERSESRQAQQEWTTFILVGGGATGVEMAGAISELANNVLAGDFKNIQTSAAKIILVEGGERLLSGYDPSLSEKAKRDLERLKVDVRLNTTVQQIDDEGVTTTAGRIQGRTVIWAAGVQASPAAHWVGVDTDRSGRAKINPDCSVPGLEDVFIIGDASTLAGSDGRSLPGVAQVAIQQGTFVGRKIAAQLAQRPFPSVFRYRNLGNLATIGRRSAIAEFGRVKVSGWIAWWIWLFVHILKLVGFRNRLSVLLQWAWAYFTWDRGARLITASDWARSKPNTGESWRKSGAESGEPLSAPKRGPPVDRR
jgi:NADH dehydrogenase